VILEGEAHKKSFGILFLRAFLKKLYVYIKTISFSSWIQYKCCAKPSAGTSNLHMELVAFPPWQES